MKPRTYALLVCDQQDVAVVSVPRPTDGAPRIIRFLGRPYSRTTLRTRGGYAVYVEDPSQ